MVVAVARSATRRGTPAVCGGSSESTPQDAAVKGFATRGVSMRGARGYERQSANHLPVSWKLSHDPAMSYALRCRSGLYVAALLFSLPLLNGCVAMGIAGVEAVAVATAVGVGTVAANAESLSANVRVGYAGEKRWVNAYAASMADVQRIAREAAANSCVERGGKLQIDSAYEMEAAGFVFPPPAYRRFTSMIYFRCLDEAGGVLWN